jgi:hypothetical protein
MIELLRPSIVAAAAAAAAAASARKGKNDGSVVR